MIQLCSLYLSVFYHDNSYISIFVTILLSSMVSFIQVKRKIYKTSIYDTKSDVQYRKTDHQHSEND